MTQTLNTFGEQLKFWRKRRGHSQLSLAQSLSMSPRHLSFIETGRSRPGKAVVTRIAQALSIPLRESNQLMMAAGLPPLYPHQPDTQAIDPGFRTALQTLLNNHAPFPGFVLNRWWDLVDINKTAGFFFPMLNPGDNLIELYLDTPALQQSILNWPTVAWGIYQQLKDEVTLHPYDKRLQALYQRAQEDIQTLDEPRLDTLNSPAITTQLQVNDVTLTLTGMVARFNSPLDVQVAELKVELMFPADEVTTQFFKQLGEQP